LITVHGLINLDFADVRTTMTKGGTALMGASTASGENRAERAATEALSSPLLDGVSIHGAKNVLVNITAGRTLGIREATAATSIIQKEAGDDVEVIFGTVIDESMGADLRITVIATGFDRHVKMDGAARRRTLQLRGDLHFADYKGEENLKNLDIPAYRRRKAAVTTEPVGGDGSNEEPEVRRLNAEEIQSTERILKGDTDVPAFLRKMMD